MAPVNKNSMPVLKHRKKIGVFIEVTAAFPADLQA